MKYKEFRIVTTAGVFIATSAVLLLPSFGGMKEILTLSFDTFEIGHIVSLIMWIMYLFWFYRILTSKIIVDNDLLTHRGLIRSKQYSLKGIQEITEIDIPKRDKFKAQMFDTYITYLRLKNQNVSSLLPIKSIKNYDELKKIIQNILGTKIDKLVKEKTLLYKIADWRI